MSEPIEIVLTKADTAMADSFAITSTLNGHSDVRFDREEREKFRSLDQRVAQRGLLAIYAFLFLGDPERYQYRLVRQAQDENPYKGDGGADFLDIPADVKSSLWRSQLPLSSHHLPVPKPSRHADHAYILALVARRGEGSEPGDRVHLMGWATEDMLPSEVEAQGTFQGKFILPARSLLPMANFIPWAREHIASWDANNLLTDSPHGKIP